MKAFPTGRLWRAGVGNETVKVNITTGDNWVYGYNNKDQLIEAKELSADPAGTV
jgi:hypothetical protein